MCVCVCVCGFVQGSPELLHLFFESLDGGACVCECLVLLLELGVSFFDQGEVVGEVGLEFF